MSEQNVETIRRAIEAWNADDLDAFLAELDPDVEWHPSIEPGLEGEATIYRGHDGARRGWTEYRGEAWERLVNRPQEIRDLGESVLVLAQMDVTARATGIEFTQEIGELADFRGGKIVRVRDFLTHAEALEAAGLPKQPLQTVYEAAGGYQGLLRLARAWHERVMADEVVSHAFSHGFHPEHSERLAAYWAEALGGPATFSVEYGDESSVVRLHSGHGPHEEMDRRAIACFDEALKDVGFADDDRVRRVLHDYFSWATATTMSRYHESADDVPDGLGMPRWSWNGLVS